MRPLHLLFIVAAGLAAPGVSQGDVFLLETEGTVRGQVLNPDESPRKTYVVKTPSGGEVTLEASQVKQVFRQSDLEMEYDRLRLRSPDTVEGQWELAEWCRENKLNKQRTTHLERVIALDANHEKARHALGFENHGGKWTTRDDNKKSQGYVKYKNEWLLPQDLQLREEHRKQGTSQDQWKRNINNWRKMLDTDKAEAARSSILAIEDPYAVATLAHNLANEQNAAVRLLYIETLGHIHAPAAMNALAGLAVADADDEVRLACLDRLAAARYQPAVGKFIEMLKSKDNTIVNRAGVALTHMKDPRAIAPLIDALVTTHLFKVVKGQPGQQSHSFGSGPGNSGGSFTFGGGGVQLVKEPLKNPQVLEALVALTANNFEYDVKSWKDWYAAQKKRTTVDARRD